MTTYNHGRRVERIDAIAITEVIRLTLAVGEGTDESPVRRVEQYWTKDGHFLVEDDHWLCEQEQEPTP